MFSLRAFCCIIYDGQISPEVSELLGMHVMVDPSMIWRTIKRILKQEQICKTNLEYVALAVGFLSIIFSDSMGEMLKKKDILVYTYVLKFLEVSSFYCFSSD